ncbi:hypothetical protein ONZ45_g18184 [Pleurotus djamor]|nr:hypothetical protein ONZ45_g18184 [Pleurotus djamor]
MDMDIDTVMQTPFHDDWVVALDNAGANTKLTAASKQLDNLDSNAWSTLAMYIFPTMLQVNLPTLYPALSQYQLASGDALFPLWRDKSSISEFIVAAYNPSQPPPSPQPQAKIHRKTESTSPPVPDNVKAAVRAAFDTPIQDDSSVKLLLSHIASLMKSPQYYSRTLAIIQSSGTGKSRLISGAAQQLVTLSLCVRGPDPDGNYCGWYQLLANPELREAFYKRVVTSTKSIDVPNGTLDENGYLRQELVEEASGKMCNALDGLRSVLGKDTPIIVSFDEVHALGSEMIAAITSAFADFAPLDHNVAAILLSTQSSMSTLAPSLSKISSTRMTASTGKALTRPFTELALDAFEAPPPDLLTTLAGIRSVEAASRLGRPMWYAHFQQRDRYGIPRLIRLAETKLILAESFADATDTGRFAPIACRVFVHFGPANRLLAEELVHSHLAFVFFVDETRTELEVGYPPEPLVGAAAARLMTRELRHVHDQTPPWLRLLQTHVVGKLIARGDRGELTTRVQWTLCRDYAYIEAFPTEPFATLPRDVVPGHEPIPLRLFLRYLFGSEAWDEIKLATPENLIMETTLEDYFAKAVVDFTCFTMADDDFIFTVDGIISALEQGCAVVCKAGQKVYDHALPVVLDPSKPIDKDNIALLCDQSKNRSTKGTLIIDLKVVPIDIPIISIINQHGHGNVGSVSKLGKQRGSKRGGRNPKARTKPHYQLYLRDSPVLPPDIRQSLLEFDSPFHSYTKNITKEWLVSNPEYVKARLERLTGNRYHGSSSSVTMWRK